MNVMVFLVAVLVAGLVLVALIQVGDRKPARRGGQKYPSRQSAPRLADGQIAARWLTIQGMAASGGGNGLRQAIMEADKLFDQVLRQRGVAGETMGERLKSARTYFSDRSVNDAVWSAHKLRNALAHEMGFDLVASQARDALAGFERGLKDLGAL